MRSLSSSDRTARSTVARAPGLTTPEGKARSAQNARKHGFTASTFAVVRLEDLQEIAHLKDDLLAVYQPVNGQELFALKRIALAQQGLLRAARIESASSPLASTKPSTNVEIPSLRWLRK